jgi:allantoinase
MTERLELIVRNGTVVTGTGRFDADIGVAEGRIALIAEPGGLSSRGVDEIDARGLFVLPGVIDGHVHFREPGLEYKEDWGSGSRAAVMGGVTTVLEMPNTRPPTSTAELVEAKQRLAEDKSYCDFGLYGLVIQENLDELEPMARAGVVGYKCFLGESTGSIQPPDDGLLLDAMQRIQGAGLRIGFHAENNQILQHMVRKLKAAGRTDPWAHVDSRPAVAEAEAIQRVALFARTVGTKIHIFHLSSAGGLELVDEWRRRGVDLTCETTPHYCFLTSDGMHSQGPMLRMNPPVREPGHTDKLLQGVIDGRIDCIATDHSPHALEEKQHANIWDAVSGFAGVELSLRLFLTHAVNTGKMTLEEYARAASERPARIWGLYPRKGAVRVGSDADFTVVDLHRRGTIEAASMHGKNNHSPFEGSATEGQAVATIVRGQIVMRDGQLVGLARGRMLRPTYE